jgi:transcriptional regulator with XRE-family HTH domain
MIERESLGQYVRRVLKEKGLTLTDVQRRAGGGISRGYICDISNGHITSLTLKKLQALARGLDVPEEELFSVARGAPPRPQEFAESRFAVVCARYLELAEEDQKEVAALLDLVAREIERRRGRRSGELSCNEPAAAAACERRPTTAEVDWCGGCYGI